MTNKILERYKNKVNIEDFKDKIIKSMRSQKNLIFGNKISLAKLKILTAIDNILNDDNNFITCDLCGEKYSLAEINIDFENVGDKICHNCQDNYFFYCNECGDPIYNENQGLHILEDEIYCQTCFFEVKEDLIKNTDLTDKKLIALNRLLKAKKLKVTYDNIKQYDFKIDKYDFNVEQYAGHNYRLGSWTANSWVDLCSNEKYLLKAIQYTIKDKKIIDINDRASIYK